MADIRQPYLPTVRMAGDRQRDARWDPREYLGVVRERNDRSVIGNLPQCLFDIRMACPRVSESRQPKRFSLMLDFDRLIIQNSDPFFFKRLIDASAVIPPVVIA